MQEGQLRFCLKAPWGNYFVIKLKNIKANDIDVESLVKAFQIPVKKGKVSPVKETEEAIWITYQPGIILVLNKCKKKNIVFYINRNHDLTLIVKRIGEMLMNFLKNDGNDLAESSNH